MHSLSHFFSSPPVALRNNYSITGLYFAEIADPVAVSLDFWHPVWRGAETDNESNEHSIVIAENVSLGEFLRKVPERGIGCKIALKVNMFQFTNYFLMAKTTS